MVHDCLSYRYVSDPTSAAGKRETTLLDLHVPSPGLSQLFTGSSGDNGGEVVHLRHKQYGTRGGDSLGGNDNDSHL